MVRLLEYIHSSRHIFIGRGAQLYDMIVLFFQ